jgi:uncharacterized membrane protein
MKTAILLIIALTLAAGSVSAGAGQPDDDLKKAALGVLVQKCNVCHQSANPGRVFTAGNMESLAPRIYKQVFVKRRMPKGRTIRLTGEEEQQLKSWLERQVTVAVR